MGSGRDSPYMDPSSPTDGGIRKRVCKACDRCRLKKSKCDGSSPCSRCRADNAICVFGERKKSHDKVYPKGYVEMLESQQSQLVAGLQELYRRLQTGEGWTGVPLKENRRGAPLTHDILDRLGALKQEDHGSGVFEEDLEILQRRLASQSSTRSMQRESSFDTNSEISGSPSFEHIPMHKFPTFTNPFQQTQKFPPTPPGGSPHSPVVKTSSPLRSQIPAFQHSSMNQSWQPSMEDYNESMDYNMTFDQQFNDATVDMMAFQAAMFTDPTVLGIAPSLTMKDWQDDRYYNSNMLS